MKRLTTSFFLFLTLLVSLTTTSLATSYSSFTLTPFAENGLYGFQTRTGTILIPAQFQAVGEFSEGLAKVKKNNAWGYVSTSGILLVNCIYDEVYDFHEGYAVVGNYDSNGTMQYGYIDRTGAAITPVQYAYAQSFSEGMAVVGQLDDQRTTLYYQNGGWKGPLYQVGYIDTTGTLVIPMMYDMVDSPMGDFSEGRAMVLLDESPYQSFPLFSFVDTSGNLLAPFTYCIDSYPMYQDGYVVITAAEPGTYTPCIQVWDSQCKVVLDAIELGYNKLSYLGQGLYLASYTLQSAQRYYEVIDLQGQVILTNVAADSYVSEGYLYTGGSSFLASSLVNTTVEALPSGTQFMVNDTYIEVNAYLIEDENYIKLRDLAMLLQGSSKQFQILWDEESETISMVSGSPYTVVGGELSQGDDLIQYATPTSAQIYVDYVDTPFTAYLIGGNNYFRLRDVMEIFDVSVTWDASSYTAILDTSLGYQG